MIDQSFILAGRAVFTVSSPKGGRYTYKVSLKAAEGRYPDTWFCKLLTGPDNTSDFTYMGILDRSTMAVRLTAKSAYGADSTPVKVLVWALAKIQTGSALPAGYEIHHEGKCGRCGRALTVPESIVRGIGPECYGKM